MPAAPPAPCGTLIFARTPPIISKQDPWCLAILSSSFYACAMPGGCPQHTMLSAFWMHSCSVRKQKLSQARPATAKDSSSRTKKVCRAGKDSADDSFHTHDIIFLAGAMRPPRATEKGAHRGFMVKAFGHETLHEELLHRFAHEASASPLPQQCINGPGLAV